MTPIIRTFTGRLVNPLALTEDDIHTADIAHHLSCINRFNGAVQQPLNVAQHSWWVAQLVEKYGARVELQACLHDAAEAYLGDVTKWLKQSDAMAGYRDAEDRAHEVIMRKFGLPVELHPAIVDADRVMVCVEGRYGFGDDAWPFVPDRYPALTKEEANATACWTPWKWRVSRNALNERMHELFTALDIA